MSDKDSDPIYIARNDEEPECILCDENCDLLFEPEPPEPSPCTACFLCDLCLICEDCHVCIECDVLEEFCKNGCFIKDEGGSQ